MAKAETEQQSSPRGQNRFLVMLLVGAALVSAAKDFGRLHDLTSSVVGFAGSLHQTVNAAAQSPVAASCPQTLAENDRAGQPFNRNGRVSPDQLIEMKDSNSGIDAVASVGRDLELVAVNRARRSKPATVPIQNSPRATEASRTLHPKEFSSRRNIGEAGWNRSANQSATIRVRNKEVQLKFTVRAPAGVEFVKRRIIGEIKATSLGSSRRAIGVCPIGTPRVDARLENGRMNVSAKLQAEVLGREINARLADENGTDAVEFKTSDGTVSLELNKEERQRR